MSMWKRNDDPGVTPDQPSHDPAPAPPQPAPSPRTTARSGGAVIGPSIRIQGDLSGDEDLLVEGRVDGKIDLKKNNVTIGSNGRVKADVYARSISVEGEVKGNLFAAEQITVRQSGHVLGNITAPRVSLEDGAQFKGSIDMERKNEGADRQAANKKSGGGKPDSGKPGGGGAGSDKPEATGSGGNQPSGSNAGSSSGGGGGGGQPPRQQKLAKGAR